MSTKEQEDNEHGGAENEAARCKMVYEYAVGMSHVACAVSGCGVGTAGGG